VSARKGDRARKRRVEVESKAEKAGWHNFIATQQRSDYSALVLLGGGSESTVLQLSSRSMVLLGQLFWRCFGLVAPVN